MGHLLLLVVLLTDNFLVDADDPVLAGEIVDRIEGLRDDVALKWTGAKSPRWDFPCLVIANRLGDDARPWSWTYESNGRPLGISIRGGRENILNHALPHEVTHAVVMAHFGRTLPLWADEGIAVSSERDCPHRLHGKCGRMSLHQLFTTRNYPSDWESFYGQSYSVVTYLVDTFGRDTFFDFVLEGDEVGWNAASKKHFNKNIVELENGWIESTQGP